MLHSIISVWRHLTFFLVAVLILSSCGVPPGAGTSTPTVPTVGDQPTGTPAATHTPVPQPTATERPTGLWLSPALPEAFVTALELPEGLQVFSEPTGAAFQLEVGGGQPVSTWVYALAAPFPNLTDDIGFDTLQSAWSTGKPTGLPFEHLLTSQNTLDAFLTLWGEPGSGFVQVLPDEDLLEAAWKQPGFWALLPFEQLQPNWKVIRIDGQSPIQKHFDPVVYPLILPISLTQSDAAPYQLFVPASNRDPEQLTTVVITGVTALVRATAALMHLYGWTYPGQDIRGWLRDADITHISNEASFTPDCPAPWNRGTTELIFCSRPEYIELLDDLGTDVVEMDGDHLYDWGSDPIYYTLDLYDQRGWQYYGGGRDLADALQPALFEHNGNRIAFLGCNGKAPGYGTASEISPGAIYCDMDLLTQQIQDLRAEGYLPIVTFQHREVQIYGISPALQPDFQAAAQAGAVIVSGSQAHQPQAMEFDEHTFIHYGLGNLFFDQYYESLANRQAFVDRHVFYNGQYISTEILTIMFVDYARPRPMTADERLDLLNIIFTESGWGYLLGSPSTNETEPAP
jgi:poly-gamma-glutamate synthesis protein (capsule biosynthesis protein)